MTLTPLFTTQGLVHLEQLPAEVLSAEEIGGALARINRFAGRTPAPWSVAAHSVLVSRLAQADAERAWGLMHDAHEAFIGDIISPAIEFLANQSMPVAGTVLRNAISQAKITLDRQIARAWQLPTWFNRERLHHYDQVAFQAEAIWFFGAVEIDDWPIDVDRALDLMSALTPGHGWEQARDIWLAEVAELAATGILTPPDTQSET